MVNPSIEVTTNKYRDKQRKLTGQSTLIVTHFELQVKYSEMGYVRRDPMDKKRPLSTKGLGGLRRSSCSRQFWQSGVTVERDLRWLPGFAGPVLHPSR